MGRVIDKLLIISFLIIAMYNHIHGNYLLVFIYGAITFAAINIYLFDIKERSIISKPKGIMEICAYILQIACILLVVPFPVVIYMMPLCIYDACQERNLVVWVLAVIVNVNIIYIYATQGIMIDKTLDGKSYIAILCLCILSVYLAVITEKRYLLENKYKNLRDDMSINQDALLDKNKELINAKDVEIYNAQLSERNRIAREIHDNVGHMLSRAILQMGALLSIYKEDPLNSQLSDVRETLDGAMNSIRSSVHDLHDESLDVKMQIENMAKALEEKYKVYLDIDVDNDMDRNIKYAVIGTVKEGISNIMKYSNNSNVDIKLISHPSIYQLTIHDYDESSDNNDSSKGSNSEPIKSDGSGMGLLNIRNRIESVGGIINIITEDGFKIFATIPKKK